MNVFSSPYIVGGDNGKEIEREMNKIEDPAPPAPKADRKGVVVLSSAIVGALALFAGGIIGIPKLIHAQHLTQYHELTEEHATVETARAEANANEKAALGLHELQHLEAVELADRLAGFGETGEPVLTKAHSAALIEAADTLNTALGRDAGVDGTGTDDEASAKSAERVTLTAAVEAAREVDVEAAAEESKEADLVTAEPVKSQGDTSADALPVNYLEFSIPVARDIAFPAAPMELTTISDDKVDADVIETLREMLDRSKAMLTDAQAKEAAAAKRVTTLSDAVEETRDLLAEIAESFPEQAAEVAKSAPKAKDTKKLDAAANIAAEGAGTIHGTWAAVADYVFEAKALQAAHKKIVDKETADAAAAGAAASGAGGYSDPATGNYVYVEPGWSDGANTWSGGANTWSGGGGNIGGGVPSGSGGTGVGGYDPGYTPPPHSCTPPPPGWYPSGGSANGCPTYLPPGGGDTEGW